MSHGEKQSSSRVFKAVQKKIAGKYGGNMKKAGAILAAATRKAKRGKAGKRNPRLRKVKG